jgi:hypothetical protein
MAKDGEEVARPRALHLSPGMDTAAAGKSEVGPRLKIELWCWFTPVIPATQEAEIRRIVVQSQPG